MKKISKSLCCISLFVLCLCLNACGASKKEPEDEMIKEGGKNQEPELVMEEFIEENYLLMTTD